MQGGAYESSSSKNENYAEEHFVHNWLFTGSRRSCADGDRDDGDQERHLPTGGDQVP